MQMDFNLLNNITKTLIFEANNENITIHSANFILGSTLPDGNIKTHITINNNAIDIDRILCYTTFTDAQGEPYITNADGTDVNNPAYISAVPTDERIIIDFKMNMWFLNAIVNDLMHASGSVSAYDVVSGIVTFGSVLVDIHQYAMQYSAAAGNVATAVIDTGKEVTGTFLEVIGDIFTNKPPTLEELVAEILKDLNRRSQSYSVKKVGDDFYTGIGDKIKDYAQGNNSFKSIHFNKSGFKEPVYTPDVNFGSFVNDTSGFNLFPATTSLVAFKNAYDVFVDSKNAQIATINSSISAIELNIQPLKIPKTFTITLLDISPFNNYNLYFQGEDRNNIYTATDVNSPLDFQLNYSDGDTLIINTANIKDLLGYGTYANIFFYICIDGVNNATWFNGDGLTSITFILDINKLYQFKAGYYDALYNEYIIYTNQLNISSSFNTAFYTKTQIDNKNYLTEHQSLELYALKTELNTYGDANVNTLLSTKNYATVSQLSSYGDANVNTLLSTKNYATISQLSSYGDGNVLTYLTDNNYAKVSQLNTYGDDNVLTYLTDNNYAKVSQLNTYGDSDVLTYLNTNNYITTTALDNIDLTNYVHKSFLFVEAIGNEYSLIQNQSYDPYNIGFTGTDRNGDIQSGILAIFFKNDKIQISNLVSWHNYDTGGSIPHWLIFPNGVYNEISFFMVNNNEYITLNQVGNYGWAIKISPNPNEGAIFQTQHIFTVQDTAVYTENLLPNLTYGDTEVNNLLSTKGYLTEHQSLELYALKTELNTYGDSDVLTYLNTNNYISSSSLDLSGYYDKTEVDSLFTNLEIPSSIPTDLLVLPSETYTIQVNASKITGKRRNFTTTLLEDIPTSPTLWLIRFISWYLNGTFYDQHLNTITVYSNDVITIIKNNELIPNYYSQANYRYFSLIYILKTENVSVDILDQNADIDNNIAGKVGAYTLIQNTATAQYQTGSSITTTITFTIPKDINPLYEYRIGYGKTDNFGTQYDGYFQAIFTVQNNPQSDSINNNYIQDLPIANIVFPNTTGFLKITNGNLTYDATGGGSSSTETQDLSIYALISNTFTQNDINNNFVKKTDLYDYSGIKINDNLLNFITNNKIDTSYIDQSTLNFITNYPSIEYNVQTTIGDYLSTNNFINQLSAGSGITISGENYSRTITCTLQNTDTTYTGSANQIDITNNVISISPNFSTGQIYTAGNGIEINGNTISSTITDTNTIYTGKTDEIVITNNEISISPNFLNDVYEQIPTLTDIYEQIPSLTGTLPFENTLTYTGVYDNVNNENYNKEVYDLTTDQGIHGIIEVYLKGNYYEQTFTISILQKTTVSMLLLDTLQYNHYKNIDLEIGLYTITIKPFNTNITKEGVELFTSQNITTPDGFTNNIIPDLPLNAKGIPRFILRYKKLYQSIDMELMARFNNLDFINDFYQKLISNGILGLWTDYSQTGNPTEVGQIIQTKYQTGGYYYEWDKTLNWENLKSGVIDGYLYYNSASAVWGIVAGGASGSGGLQAFTGNQNTLSFRKSQTSTAEIKETVDYIRFSEEVEFNGNISLENINETIYLNFQIYSSADKSTSLKDRADIFLCNDIKQWTFDRLPLTANLDTYGTLFRINYENKLHILRNQIECYEPLKLPKIIFADSTEIISVAGVLTLDSTNDIDFKIGNASKLKISSTQVESTTDLKVSKIIFGDNTELTTAPSGGGGGVSYPLSGDDIFEVNTQYKSTDDIYRLWFIDGVSIVNSSSSISLRINNISKLGVNNTDITTPVNINCPSITFSDGTQLTSASSTLTFRDILPINAWLSTSDNINRFFFSNNSDSYYRTGNDFRFRNSVDKDLLKIKGDTVDTELRITATEAGDAKILFGTPNASAQLNKHNCAIIADGMYSWSRADLCFCVGNVASNASTYDATTANARIRIKYNGYTSITGASSSVSGWARLIRYNENYIHSQANRSGNVVLYVGGSYWAGDYFISSDSRIKKDIEELEDQECLQKILQLKPCKYRYIDDSKNKSDGKVYGFIAQEIKEVFPEAVSIQKECLPNVMKKASITDKNTITLLESLQEITETIELQNDMEINIYDINDNKITCKIIEKYDENNFKIDKDIQGDFCFVYGSITDDFNTINKEYINCVNISAVQELYKKIINQQQKINELESKLNMIMNHLNLS